MNNYNDSKSDKKGGLIGLLTNLFRSGSSLPGTGGLFASKAGIMGALLGGATIAAGVAVVYNFVGPSSAPVYQPGLFQDKYYESLVKNAQQERAAVSASAKSGPSLSLEYVKQQAANEAIAGVSGSASSGESAESSAEGQPAGGAADEAATAAAAALGGGSGAPTLKKANSLVASAGGLKLGGAGLSGGIGQSFQQVYRPTTPLKTGSVSSLKDGGKGRLTSSMRAVSRFNKKGAYAQAKAVKNTLGSTSGRSLTTSKDGLVKAYGEGSTAGGDVEGADVSGTGVTGGGVSDGNVPKGSDAGLNSNTSTVPEVSEESESDATPWEKYSNWAMYLMLAAVALLAIAAMVAKAHPGLAKVLAYAALACAVGMLVCSGFLFGYGQKWTGAMYAVLSLVIGGAALKAAAGDSKASEDTTKAKATQETGVSDKVVQSLKPGEKVVITLEKTTGAP